MNYKSKANLSECCLARVKPSEVEKLSKKLLSCARDAKRLGLTIFGGPGRVDLRKRERDDGTGGALIVADLGAGPWDGGDGGHSFDEKGLLRGES
jgi:hypothetical protein